MTNQPARVRFAPSPTGHMHLGSARTALYDYLLAKQTGGQFVLRIEDTDTKRYVPGAEEELMAGLRWLGLEWDEGPDKGGPYGPYRQSERKEIYQKYAQELIASDHAFCCFCSSEHLAKVREDQQKRKEPPHYDGTCRNLSAEEVKTRIANGEKYVIRFKTPKEGSTTVHDHLRGDITVENRTLDDYILVKSDGWALYHLAAMVDDHLMKITHVVRGSEWLPTFPLHHLLYQAFGWEEPIFIHLSLFLKPSGKGKMSKRESAELIKDGYSIFVRELRELGYLPEAVVNWTALMGWAYDDHTEFFSLADLVEKFSIDHLNPSPAAINFTKFDHFNGLHIRALSDEDLAGRILPFFIEKGYQADLATLVKIAPLIKERLATLDDAPELAGFFFHETVDPKVEELVGKNMTAQESAVAAQKVLEMMQSINSMEVTTIEPPLRELVEGMGYTVGQVFGILRVAVTGQRVSPPLFESMEIIGRDKVLNRIKKAIELLQG
ncbi:MAG: glutamate--tRNA ligase [Anaerolineaceae bacterium]|nr:glutamate--tRNA ligase [Anaerolineaceae bacterium]